jgi:hypothetical protein
MKDRPTHSTLVGAWRLLSWENRTADGQVTYPMGIDALGSLLYTADGRFSVMSREVAALYSQLATCSAARPRSRPKPWRALWATRAA